MWLKMHKSFFMDDLYTILVFVAFIAYSLYRNFNKAAKKKAAAPQRPAPQPVKEIFESLFGEEFTEGDSMPESVPVDIPNKPKHIRITDRYNKYLSESDIAESAFKPVYNDIKRPKISNLKTFTHTHTKSNLNVEPSVISTLFVNDGNDLRKAIIYQTILERPYE